MKNKVGSILIITVIYLITIATGTILYLNIELQNPIYRLLIIDVVMTLMIWVLSLILKNASLYDPYWSVIPPVLMLIFMIDYDVFGSLNMILLISLLVWAIRLTYNWAKLWKDFSHVDWRYINIKQAAPKLYFLSSLFGVMLFPTIIVFVQLTGIFNVLALNESINLLSLIGCLIIIGAAILQLISDSQMQAFKKDPKNKGKIIQSGLWKYSRHPNYLGEILVWVGCYLVYFANFGFDYMILAPIIMIMMFLFISIPMLEKRQLKAKPSYKDYMDVTSMLIPLKFMRVSNKD